jgi:hypothetical protein
MVIRALTLDHIVIGCATLEQGAEYIRSLTGVEVPPGGRHERMGSHNRLMRISEETYLELIAIDPDAAAPAWPRWFALDNPAQRARLRERPRPIAWVAGTSNIVAVLAASSTDLGRPVEMTRGPLRWRISLRDDGALADGGALPVLIEWPGGKNPAAMMADLGVRLERTRVTCSDSTGISASLAALGAEHLVDVVSGAGAPTIEVDLRTPSGARVTLR